MSWPWARITSRGHRSSSGTAFNPRGWKPATICGDADWLVQAAGQLFLNGERIVVADGGLIGAAALAEPAIIAAAAPERLYLSTRRGELIENLDRSNRIPMPLERIGVTASGTLAVHAAAGRFEADKQVTSWSKLEGERAQHAAGHLQ